MWDSFTNMFGGGGGPAPAADLPAIGAPAADAIGIIGLPPGGSVDSGPGTGITNVVDMPASGAGGGGFNPAMLGKLGGAGMGLMNMFRTSPTEAALEKAQKLQMSNASAASASGKQQLNQYTQGQLSPAQQASVDQFKKQQLAKWRQYLATAGIPESSAMADIEAKVNQDAAAYAQQLLQQNYNNSMTALGLSGNTLAQAAQANLAQEKEIAASQAAAMEAIGEIFGAMG